MPLLSALSFTAALALLAATGVTGALALRLESLTETLLSAYVIGWAWLVVSVVALSPSRAVTATALWLLLVVGAAVAVAVRRLVGRPPPPASAHAAMSALRSALADPPVLAVAVAFALALGYTLAVGVGVAANDGDALAYHLPRALFWRQQHAVGWIADVVDPRLNVMPPVAEIGQLATMLVAGSDRFVAVGPFAALGASMVAIVALARRLEADHRGAVFGALLFGTLPVVLLQAASALNDLVVCSFLLCAAVLLVSTRSAGLAVGSLATGLAVATKVTAAFGLPWLVVLAVAVRRDRLLVRLVAIAVGALLGSWWYWLDLWHTGHFDGGYGEDAGQRPSGPGVVATTMRRLTLDLLDRSGVRGEDVALFAVAALALLAAWVFAVARGRPARGLLGGAALVAVVPYLLDPLGRLLLRAWQEGWSALGDAELAFQLPARFTLPVLADATESWFGPVLPLCLVLAPIALLVGRGPPRRGALLACSLAPLASIVFLAALVTYDPYRGRFLMFAVALATATWGWLLRWRSVAWALAGLTIVSSLMSVAMSLGKPSGLVLLEKDPGLASRVSIWSRTRVEQQGQLRPGDDEIEVLGLVEANVPDDAPLALAPRENDYLSPLFGGRLGRRILLVPGDGVVPREATWLVSAPRTRVSPCPEDWQQEFAVGDWKVLRRVGRGGC